MRSTFRFRVEAPVEVIYKTFFVPERWFTFFYAYRGLESVDSNWPEQGSSIVVRSAALSPWAIRLRQTIVEHERGRRICIREEALSGLWIDNVEFHFDPEDGATNVTLVTDQTSKFLLGRLVFLLMSPLWWPLNRLINGGVVKRFKAMVEAPEVRRREER